MTSVFETFASLGIVPVLEIEQEEQAVPTAQALAAGGLPAAEVTLRTPAALGSIRRIATQAPGVLVGAGTVLTLEQARAARDAGAQFLVAPGLAPAVVAWALEQGIPVLPGVMTPSEITAALGLGLNLLKFFPAEPLGGVRTIEAMSDPFPGLRFIPTGGIRPENIAVYLRSPRILAVGGSWMARRAAIRAGQFEQIETLTRQAVDAVREARAARV